MAIAGAYSVGFSKVQFVLSGGGYDKTVIGTTRLTMSGSILLWDTTKVPNGTYSLQSLATNRFGVRGYSAAITVKVDN